MYRSLGFEEVEPYYDVPPEHAGLARVTSGWSCEQPEPDRVPAYGVAVRRQHERHVVVPRIGHLLDPAVAGVEAHLADVDREHPVGWARTMSA